MFENLDQGALRAPSQLEGSSFFRVRWGIARDQTVRSRHFAEIEDRTQSWGFASVTFCLGGSKSEGPGCPASTAKRGDQFVTFHKHSDVSKALISGSLEILD